MTEKRPTTSDHGAPGPRGAPDRPAGDEPDDITDIVNELTASQQQRPANTPDLSEFQTGEHRTPGSNPYFRPPKADPTVELPALRPLSDAVITPVHRPPQNDTIAMEPASEDSTLNQAILTKRLPLPPKAEAVLAEMESIVAEIPEAKGRDTEVRQQLPQSRVIADPGLLFNDDDLPGLRDRLGRGLLASLARVMRERVSSMVDATASVPFGLDYYSLRAASNGASIVESPSLLEAAFIARVDRSEKARRWAIESLLAKCRQNNGLFHDRAGASPDALPGRGCVVSIRDVALAWDLVNHELAESERQEVAAALHRNGQRLAAFINNPAANAPSGISETGAMALGLAGLPLMNIEAFYVNAKRWVDSAESRASALLASRIADNGRPAASDIGGLTELMRFMLPFMQAFRRYYNEDMLQGEGGNLSALPRWIAHQFGSGRYGLFASSRIRIEELWGATPLLAKLADTYRDGVAQWLLQQISVAEAAKRAGEQDRTSGKYRLEMPAMPGVDSVLTAAFFDPSLQASSPDMAMTPGARLSETRAVVRADWDPASPIVTLQSEAGTLPYVQFSSQGVGLRLLCETELFEGMGGVSVVGRVRDYIDMGGAAYINGDFKGSDGSLAQRHLLFLRTEQTALLFDRYDVGDGRTAKRAGLRISGSDSVKALDRGTLSVRSSDGSDRTARFVFFSNGFSQGVEAGGDGVLPGLTLEFARGRGDLASIIALGRQGQLPEVRRINPEERGRVYRATMGEGAILFNGWQGGMPQQCGWVWSDALMAYVDRRDDYPGRYVAIKATSVLAYDMQEGIHLGYGASHPDDPDKPVEFSLCASGPQAVIYLSTRAHVRVSFPGLKRVFVDGTEAEIEGDAKVYVLSRPLEPGRHLIEFDHESPGPESSIVVPREDQFVGGNFTLHASIGDPIGVENARLVIDQQYYGPVLEAGPWVWKVDAGALAEGTHEAQIEARDVLGHVRRSMPRRFRVDNTAPAVTLGEPKEGKKTRGVLTFVADASDPNGVERVQFCIDGKKVGDPVTTAPYSRDIDTSTFEDGIHVVTALAFDAAGNVGQSAPARVIFANNAPPPQMVKLKIKPPVLAVQPLQEVQLECIGIDDEDNEQPVRVQWRQLKGAGVVDRNNIFTAPGTEGPCVMEAQIVGTTVRAKLNALVSRDVET